LLYVPPVVWEVAGYRGEDTWEVLGRADGSNPQVAVTAWLEKWGIEQKHDGVRSPGQSGWIRFRVGADGQPIPIEVT